MGNTNMDKERGGADSAEPGSVTLVLSEGDKAAETGDCGGLLTHDESGTVQTFLVSYFEDAESEGFRTTVSRQDADEPGNFGETMDVGVREMTTLGAMLMDAVERSEEEGSTLVVCFDSLTELLRHNSQESLYVFTHLLTTRLRNSDAVAHVHLDPGSVDESTVRTFGALFDRTVSFE